VTRSAELYALTHRGNAGDVVFYRRACRGVGSVLELGCGSGRMLAGLTRPGQTLVGLDLDAGLLAIARKSLGRRARLVRGDMRDFELGERFERVLIPYSGFYCLLTRRDALACLRAARRHLTDDGKLIFDAYAADAFHRAEGPTGEELDWLAAIELQGRVYDLFERSRWQRGRQRLDVTYVYRDRRSSRVVELPLPQRYWLASQLRELLSAAGLELEAVHGDFRGHRYSPARSELMVVTARPR
jgi:SAM-dependent methyltransferase